MKLARHVPNILSSYRLAAVPAIVWALWTGDRTVFAILITLNLITDILDGLLARLLRAETELGARLDSYADIGTFALAVAGLFRFELPTVREHGLVFAGLVANYLIPQLLSVARFRRPVSMHLYSTKVVAYLQGIFFVFLFAGAFLPPYFYFMAAAAFLNGLEEVVILLILREPRSNVRGLWWVLRPPTRAAQIT